MRCQHPNAPENHSPRCAYRLATGAPLWSICNCGIYTQWLIAGSPEMAKCAKDTLPPMPACMPCPYCGIDHIDAGEWQFRPHHKHKCLHCGKLFRFEGEDGEYFYGVADPDHYP